MAHDRAHSVTRRLATRSGTAPTDATHDERRAAAHVLVDPNHVDADDRDGRHQQRPQEHDQRRPCAPTTAISRQHGGQDQRPAAGEHQAHVDRHERERRQAQRERLPGIAAEEREVRAAGVPGVALVGHEHLRKPSQTTSPRRYGSASRQPEQVVDDLAREQLEVAGIDRQLDRAIPNWMMRYADPRREHLQRALAVPAGADRVHDVGARHASARSAPGSLPAGPAGRRPCRRRRRRAPPPSRRARLRRRRSAATGSAPSRVDSVRARSSRISSERSVEASFTKISS